MERGLEQAGLIDDLADRLDRLAPSHRDPHAFHETKSEIAHELRQLAADLRSTSR